MRFDCCRFNNTTPIVQIKSKINFNNSVLSAVLDDSSMTYCNNNLEEEEETQIASNDADVIHVTISNVSSSFDVKTHLNLRYLALNWHNVEYRRNQRVFIIERIFSHVHDIKTSALCSLFTQLLFMKLRKPPVTANIRSSGKIICFGTPSEYEAKIAARRIARIIQRLGYPGVQFSRYKTINVLGSCTLPFKIRIIQFAIKYKSNTQ